MRRIGYIESQEPARRFGDYLLTKGMENKVDDFEDGWAVWVENEDLLVSAMAEWKEFVRDVDNPKYAGARDAAEEIRSQKRRENESRSKRHRDLRTTMALGAGAELADAARLANLAAGIVVGKVGTSVVHCDDLLRAIHAGEWSAAEAKVLSLASAADEPFPVAPRRHRHSNFTASARAPMKRDDLHHHGAYLHHHRPL